MRGPAPTVVATVRPETPDELEEGRQLTAYRDLFKELRPDRLMELRPERPDRPERG